MPSKLGPHIMQGGDPVRWVEAGAGVLKFTPEVLGASSLVPEGPLVIGKLDQEDVALFLTDWKALQRRGMTPQAAADLRFNAQRNIFVGSNKPRLDRYAANPRVDVWEDDNEVVPDSAAEADWYCDYCIEMMQLYDSIGKKRANFSFAVGTPDIRPGHADDIWPRLLPAVRYARDNGHYIALHEYMGYAADFGVGWRQVTAEREPVEYWHGRYGDDDEPDEGYPYGWVALRYRFIYARYFLPAGLGDVNLMITEAGCDSVESVTPVGVSVGTWKEHAGHWRAEGDDPEERYAAMLGWYDDRMREDAFVVGATIFTVGHVGIWANWDIAGTGVEARVLGRINMLAGGDDPVVVPPVTPTPPPPPPTPPTGGMNMLVNPSFEDGHYDLYNAAGERLPIQVPNGWTFKFDVWPGAVNPIEPEVAHSRFGQPECNVLHRSKFPESEWGQFGLDGEYIYKWFGKAHRGRLQQVVGELPAGEYEVRFPIFVDAVRGYAGGAKLWADDSFACNVRVRVNERDVPLVEELGPWPFEQGAVTEWWYQLAAGWRHVVVGRFEHPGGACKIALHVMMPFALPSNGVFVDDVGLVRVETVGEPEVPPPSPPEPPPSAKHKAIVVKLPQDVSAEEWLGAAEYAYEFRHTMTASHDDMLTILRGGNDDSYVKLCWPGRQLDVAALIEEAGYAWEPIFDEPESPLEGLKLGHLFAYRYVLTSPFDAPRGYGNKLHEGADYDIVGGVADNKVDVLCLYDGVVERSVDSAGGYGKYVRVRHERNGAPFYTRYAHLDERYVAVGKAIRKGEPVGEVGATGNALGEHVHVNLEAPGFGRSGYVVEDVVDPASYVPGGGSLPLYQVTPPSQGIDLLPYLKGDGRAYMVQHPGGPSEKFRTVDLGGGRFLQVKNNHWEEFWAEGGMIWRGVDTSSGMDTYYRQWESGREGARWCAARMAVGQTWTAPVEHVVQTYRKRDCVPVEHHRNGVATNRVTLVARLAAMTWNGVTVKDVIHLRTHTGESMWFGRGYGLVAWTSAWGVSAIAEELRASEGDNEPERGCFGP